MLHGYNSCKESFYYQIEFFSKRYRVTCLDIVGFGKSDKLKESFGVVEYAHFIEKFLEKLNIKKPNVVAHSFGGRLAIYLSAQSLLFDKVVLTGSAGVIINHGLRYKAKVYSYKLLKKIFKNKNFTFSASKEYKNLNDIQRESFKKIVNFDLRGLSKNIQNETLLLYGKGDRDTPVKIGKILNRQIKGSKLLIFENSGHFPFIDEANRFNHQVNEFLNN